MPVSLKKRNEEEPADYCTMFSLHVHTIKFVFRLPCRSHVLTSFCSAVKGHVQMSKALSPKRQALPVDDEGNRLILNPQKPGKRNAVAIDMGKQMGRESKTDMDEGNVLKLSPHKIQRYARHIETTARC